MHRQILSLFLFLFLCSFPARAETPSAPNEFHAAKTAPEKILNDILQRNAKDMSVFDFALKHPWRDQSLDQSLSRLFTEKLQNAWAAAEKKAAQADCQGDYTRARQNNKACGIDMNPITCDWTQKETFHFHTHIINDHEAQVSYLGDARGDKGASPYRMVKDRDGLWKLDSVSCSKDERYNP